MSEEEKKKKGGVSRREFLRDAGFAVGGVAVSSTVLGVACAPKEVVKEVPGKEVIKEVPGPTKTVEVPRKLTKLIVNGGTHELAVEPNVTLVEVLRDTLGLTGTKMDCNRGQCGHCTVLMDGRPTLACMVLAIEAEGRKIITIEGLTGPGKPLTPVQQAFWDYGALGCLSCTPGMIMSVQALLLQNPSPNENDVRQALSGTFCRCGVYVKAIQATLAAAAKMKGG